LTDGVSRRGFGSAQKSVCPGRNARRLTDIESKRWTITDDMIAIMS